ncbi:MAG: hypothetical protein ACI8Q3_001422 [Marinomonas primoryensis]|jgi:hypothetical protein
MKHIESISGKIEAVGQSNFDLKRTFYSYIRFLDESGNVRMIKNIFVGNTVSSYISPGTKGKFHLAKINKKTSVLFAFDNEERKVYDGEEMQAFSKEYWLVGVYFLIMVPFALLSILMFGIGLILTPICFYFSYKGILVTPRRIKDETLRTYLNQFGYV